MYCTNRDDEYEKYLILSIILCDMGNLILYIRDYKYEIERYLSGAAVYEKIYFVRENNFKIFVWSAISVGLNFRYEMFEIVPFPSNVHWCLSYGLHRPGY